MRQQIRVHMFLQWQGNEGKYSFLDRIKFSLIISWISMQMCVDIIYGF